VIRRKCVSCSYVKNKKKLVIMLRKYYTRVNRLFVFQCFSNFFKEGFCKIKGGSLGLAERGEVSGKEEVTSKNTNKEACKLQAKKLLVYFYNTV
jgi:hypothetical protein